MPCSGQSNASPGYALSVGLVRSVERKLKNEGVKHSD